MRLKRAVILLILLSLLPFIPGSSLNLYSEPESIVIEDFNKSGDLFFKEWRNMDSTHKPWDEYYLLSENGKKFLRASTERNPELSIQIGKVVNNQWNIFSYPVITWEWRVHRLPVNGNESRSSRRDSAAGIYVLFQRKKIPLVGWQHQPMNWIKYVWSTTLPVGTVIPRKKVQSGVTLYDARYIVVASGEKELGKWISFKRNVISDYKTYFGKAPSANPVMVAILTDSDKTKSRAVADYANIVARKN
mgnify:FL=1